MRVLGFMKCVGRAVLKEGIGKLAKLAREFLPFGNHVIEFVENVGKRTIDEIAAAGIRGSARVELQEAAALPEVEAAEQAAAVVKEIAPGLPPEDQKNLTDYLSQIPLNLRANFKRPEDPTGTTVPFDWNIDDPLSVASALPTGLPRFHEGDAAPEPKWKLVKLLGQGGMGEVWLGQHSTNPNLRAAYKFPRDRQGQAALLGHEGHVVARLTAMNVPGVVKLQNLDIEPEPGQEPWLKYDYIPDGDLTSLLFRWKDDAAELRTPKVLRVWRDLAEIVGKLHELDDFIVHRDLKPANVLVRWNDKKQEYELFVADFGIGMIAARRSLETLSSKASNTFSMGILRGACTPIYASPQQKAGGPLDPRDDVFSLGVIGYQLLMGRFNLECPTGRSWKQALTKIAVPAAIIDLIETCHDGNPDERPANAAVLAHEIDKALAQPKVTLAPPPPIITSPPPPPKPATRQPGEEVHFPLPRGLKMTFCWIPPGTAQLGSPHVEQNAVIEQLGKREPWLEAESEAKRGIYTSTGFWLAKYPVTQHEWHVLTGGSPSHFQVGSGGADKVEGLDTSRFPVESVSWDMICQPGGFLEKLNAVGGLEMVFGKVGQFTLPHEDQWEYACRGGKGNGQAFYWGGELNGTQANCAGNYPFGTAANGPYLERPTPVGSFAAKFPHPWGLCDMHGNMWEWCENLYEQTDSRVLRGGSWIIYAHYCRSALRGKSAPGNRKNNIGFRVFLPGLT
jgi:formylglycine-generating enzyme required for sulfatase activity